MIVGRDDLMGTVEDYLILQQKLVNSSVRTYYINGGHLCAMINKDT